MRREQTKKIIKSPNMHVGSNLEKKIWIKHRHKLFREPKNKFVQFVLTNGDSRFFHIILMGTNVISIL